ncbi:ribosome hibernation-promoting factor, HPF/YfiA family [Noviherbaspirillum massiliense]|uniref:ribosome hibernation-promoting factor, HPF/YfiA family n=1 Tax=Noviherbaspirillum massiliense TaxID=1465823 RepID=UPI0003164BB0|nr:ribosome-associated translation inhibitor RaiA [Noviherbaspirillum massiliense]
MNILISGQHLELTPAIRDYVTSKVERVVRHFDDVIDVAVILGVEKPAQKDKRQRAEVNMRLKGNVIHVESFAEDVYAAIDSMIDKLDRQVLRYKGKVQDHQHEAIKRMPEAANPAS